MSDIQNPLESIKSAYENLVKVYRDRETSSDIPFGFTDKVGFGPGIQPQCAGLFSLLYIYDSFYDNEYFPTDFFGDLNEIIIDTFRGIDQLVTESGFSGLPYIVMKEEYENKFIGKDAPSYLGDVTWLLSLSLTLRKLAVRNRIAIEPILDTVNDYIVKCLKIIVASKIKVDEHAYAWGFSSAENVAPNIYFTYIVSASLSDYLDIIHDDINQDIASRTPDVEMIARLNAELDGDMSLLEAITHSLEGLRQWYSRYILPIIQDLSLCRKPRFSDEFLYKAGFVHLNTIPDSEKRGQIGLEDSEDFNYFYYALYCLDMFIMSRTDEFFGELNNKSTVRTSLSNFYNQNKLFSSIDIKYFENDSDDFIAKYFEQNMNYLHASYRRIIRTGENYWESSKATCPIFLKYTNISDDMKFENAIEDNSKLYDSISLPLFLKVNIQHCKWITGESDKIVDAIFEDILSDRIKEHDTKGPRAKQKHMDNINYVNLWDRVHFNLLITEKSIESMIDYFDYLKFFESKEAPVHPAVFIPETIPTNVQDQNELEVGLAIKELVKNELSNLLSSAEMSDKLEQIVKQKMHTPKESVSEKSEHVTQTKPIKKIIKNLAHFDAFTGTRANYQEEFEYLELFKVLLQGFIYQSIATEIKDGTSKDKTTINYTEDLMTDIDSIIKNLVPEIAKDSRALMMLFFKLKKLS